MKRLGTALIGILFAFIAGGILLQLQGFPAFRSFGALFSYSVRSAPVFANSLVRSAPLLLTGLSAAVAFGSGVVNLGQVGQLLVGAIAAAAVGLAVDLPAPLMIPLLIVAAIVGGALWADVASLLRQRFGMDEFITTLMLNFIADFITVYLISGPLKDPDGASAVTRQINDGGVLPTIGHFPLTFAVALLALGITYVCIQRSRLGYELRMMGQNSRFSLIGGCNNNRNLRVAMAISGGLAGLAGGMLIMGGLQNRFIKGFGAGYGWDGVMIAIVAAAGIIATALYAIFFGILQTGGLGMEIETNVPSEFVLVFQAIVVLFVVATRESSHVVINRLLIMLRTRARSRARSSATDPPVESKR